MTSERQFIDDVIMAHNNRRQKHGASPLSHNAELSKVAQKWAEHLSRNNGFSHSHACLKGDKMGENLAMKWSSQPDYLYTGDDAVEQWYSEIQMYRFGVEPSNISQVGHFTQLVWLGTKEVGVGRYKGKDGKTIVVANYLPAGNVIGRFSSNVPPPGTKPTTKPPVVTNPFPKASPNNNTNQTVHFFPDASTRNVNVKHSPYSSNTTTHNYSPATSKTQWRPETKTTKTEDFKIVSPNNNSSFQPYTAYIDNRTIPNTNRTNMSKVSTSTRTHTRTEGIGSSKVTKTIVEETITYSDGRKEVNTTEKTTHGDCVDKEVSPRMTKLSLADTKSKSKAEDKPQSLKDFRAASLKAHNTYRSKHGVSSLKAAKDLDEYAQKWADHLISSCKFEHSHSTLKDGTRLGENIASKMSSGMADYTGQEVVDYWYSEVSRHNFSSPTSTGSGHFTQVVWKGTKEVGMGKACKNGKVIVVGSYRPAGNLVGSFVENVAPARK